MLIIQNIWSALLYTMFQNELDNYSLHYFINWNSYNNELTWYM